VAYERSRKGHQEQETSSGGWETDTLRSSRNLVLRSERPHDRDGVFMDHVGGNLLERSTFELRAETREALVAKLLDLSADPKADSKR